MGVLTDDMARLRGEVETLRGERGALIQHLACGAKSRQGAVAAMQAGFRQEHAAMAKHARAERAAYTARQKRAVSRLRREFAADLAGAHKAWLGKGA